MPPTQSPRWARGMPLGVIEPAMTLASVIGAQIPKGYASMVDAGWGEEVGNNFTYLPRSKEGLSGLTSLINSKPMEYLGKADEWWADKAGDLGRWGGEDYPLLQTAIQNLPYILPTGVITKPLKAGVGALRSLETVAKLEKATGALAKTSAIRTANAAHRAVTKPPPHLLNVESGTSYYKPTKEQTANDINRAAKAAGAPPPPMGIGQGVWGGQGEKLQTHPVGMIDSSKLTPKQVDVMRESLDQWGVGASRFRPHWIQDADTASAMMLHDVPDEVVRSIGRFFRKAQIPAFVTAHPNGKVLLLPEDPRGGLNQIIAGLKAGTAIPNKYAKNATFGVSRDGIDRSYVHDLKSAQNIGMPPRTTPYDFTGKR